MDLDKDPKDIGINVGRDANGNITIGNNNQIFQNAASRPVNSRGVFLPFARNALFTGRIAALEELASIFSPLPVAGDGPGVRATHVIITQAITGMGGIGKSQLALEFGHRYAERFVSIHWLDLNDPSQLEAQIAACGRAMGLPEDAKHPELVAETLRIWATDGPRLLILDNYEQPADAVQRLAPLLNLPTLRLLVTARRADFPPELNLRLHRLDVFIPSESLEFLQKLAKLGDEQIPGLQRLAETLGHLPLALHLAGHYLRETGITPDEYLAELGDALAHESMKAAWFEEIGVKSPTAHEQSLLGTFALSWGMVTDENAQVIFKAAGYLAPNEPIPMGIFAALLAVDEKDRVLKRALQQLVRVGLFTTKENLPVIHPLLVAYAQHLNGQSTKLLEKLVRKLSALSYQALETGLPAHFVSLGSHISIVARHAEHNGLDSASGALLNNYGNQLREIGDYSGAHAACECAVRLLKATLDHSHPVIASSLNSLGAVLRDEGDLGGAFNAFEDALAIDEAVFGNEHPKVARDLNNLGNVLRDLGNLNDAYILFKRALEIDETVLGKEHQQVAIDLNNLGNVLQDLDDLHGAYLAYERAYRILEADLGENHPLVAISISNKASVLNALGDPISAQNAYEHAIRVLEANFINSHPNIAKIYMDLGMILQARGHNAQARIYYRRALTVFEKFLPEGHLYVRTARKWLKLLDE